MKKLDMNKSGESEMLRSTGKNGKKRNVSGSVGEELDNASDVVANDIQWRTAA